VVGERWSGEWRVGEVSVWRVVLQGRLVEGEGRTGEEEQGWV
jgi:hypothetical protein